MRISSAVSVLPMKLHSLEKAKRCEEEKKQVINILRFVFFFIKLFRLLALVVPPWNLLSSTNNYVLKFIFILFNLFMRVLNVFILFLGGYGVYMMFKVMMTSDLFQIVSDVVIILFYCQFFVTRLFCWINDVRMNAVVDEWKFVIADIFDEKNARRLVIFVMKSLTFVVILRAVLYFSLWTGFGIDKMNLGWMESDWYIVAYGFIVAVTSYTDLLWMYLVKVLEEGIRAINKDVKEFTQEATAVTIITNENGIISGTFVKSPVGERFDEMYRALDVIRNNHIHLCKMKNSINSEASIFIIFSMCTATTALCVTVFQLLAFSFVQEERIELYFWLSVGYVAAYETFLTFFVNQLGENISERESELLAMLIHFNPEDVQNIKVKRLLKHFTMQVATSCSPMNTGGFFDIKRGTITGVLSTVVTYLIVLLQQMPNMIQKPVNLTTTATTANIN